MVGRKGKGGFVGFERYSGKIMDKRIIFDMVVIFVPLFYYLLKIDRIIIVILTILEGPLSSSSP